jgi:cell division protein FtsW
MTVLSLLKQHLPEWPGFRPAEWFRNRRPAATADERVPIRDWVDAGRPARVMGVDSALIWVVAALLAFGLVMVYSASVALPDSPRFALYTPTHFLSRQAVFIAIGLVFAFATAQVPISVWEKWAPWIFALAMVLLFLVLIPHIPLGLLNFQPSELAKLGMCMYAASYMVRKMDVKEHFVKAVWPMAVALAAIGVLLLAEPDMGAFMVIAAIALGILFLGGVNGRMFLVSVAVLLGAFTLMIVFSEFRRQRIFAYLDPWNPTYAQGKAYQLTHSLIAFGRGEIFGQGLGSSIEKLHYLPEAHTDFLLAVIGEELGFVGVFIIVGAFFWLTRRLFIIGRQAIALDRVFAGLMCQGVGLWMGAQSFINFGVNLGVLPTKGLTLPLLSYGGSGVVLNLVALALVLRVDMESRALMRGGRT